MELRSLKFNKDKPFAIKQRKKITRPKQILIMISRFFIKAAKDKRQKTKDKIKNIKIKKVINIVKITKKHKK